MKTKYIVELIYQLTKREIKNRHKGSKLGQLWTFITPVLSLCIYIIVFGLIFNGRFGVIANETFLDFTLALFLGLTIFNLISDTISTAGTLIYNNQNYVKKTIFPIEVLAVANVLCSFYYSFYNIIFIILLLPFTTYGISMNISLLPLLILPTLFITVGLSWMISSFAVILKDLIYMSGFISSVLFYSSAIVYPITKIPHKIWVVLKFNPVLLIINESRKILFWQQRVDIDYLVYIYATSLIILFTGYKIQKYLKGFFAELI